MITENLISEEVLPWFGFNGHVHLYEGPSTSNAPASAPTRLIQTDQPFHCLFHWTTVGSLNYYFCGKWKLQILFEKMGAGEFALSAAESEAEVICIPSPTSYSGYIDIAPNRVPPGVYRIVAVLTLEGRSGVKAPLAAFADLGLIQFYKEGV